MGFERPLNESYKKPEYKYVKDYSEVNPKVNSYLRLPGQFQYMEHSNDPDIHHNFSTSPYSLQKAKKYLSTRHMDEPSKFSYSRTESDVDIKDRKISLKAEINQNLLNPNYLHLTSSTKCGRRIAPPMRYPDFDEVKQRSFIESKDSPEYMRVYDREKIKDIDNYYKETNQNQQFLSRFGSWITLPPGSRDRAKALEKLPHGMYETSILAPRWMDLNQNGFDRNKAIKENTFKAIQWNNTCKDKTRVTMLIERNPNKAKPLYLCDAYERYANEQNMNK